MTYHNEQQEIEHYLSVWDEMPVIDSLKESQENGVSGIFLLNWMRKECLVGWIEKGKLHRVGKPAVLSLDGLRREWYKQGKLHNLAGPAFITPDGCINYYIDGDYIDHSEYWNHPMVLKFKIDTINQLST